MGIILKRMVWITAISLSVVLIGHTIFYFWLSSSVAFKELEKSVLMEKQFGIKSTDDYGEQKIKLDYFSVNKFSWLGHKSTLSFTVTIYSQRYKVQMVKDKNQKWKIARFDELS